MNFGTRERILRCGKELFLEKGFEQASLREISKMAGVTTGAFYRNFSDKEELFSELVDPLVEAVFTKYKEFEEKNFQNSGDNHENLNSKVNIEGTIEVSLFLFENKEILELLINCSGETKYSNFIEQLTLMQDESQKKIKNRTGSKNDIVEKRASIGIHALNHARFSALIEIVLHSDSEEELIINSKLIAIFFEEGWKKIKSY